MKWSRSRTRAVLLLLALCGASFLAWQLIHREPATLIGMAPVPNWQRDQQVWSWATLTIKEFRPTGNLLLGSVEVQVRPSRSGPKEFQQVLADFPSVLLRLYHHFPGGDVWQGASDGAILLSVAPAASSPTGKGTFSWICHPLRRAFYYPFDRYMLYVKPSLLRPGPNDSFYVDRVSQFVTDFSNTNFVPYLQTLARPSNEDDSHLIELRRPPILRLLAIIVGVLLVVWLFYLAFSAKPDQYAGSIVSLFVGVFSIRTSLLSGAPLFPSLMDYCALAVYLLAALVILIKWFLPDKELTVPCTLCCSRIDAKALVCPYCTREVFHA